MITTHRHLAWEEALKEAGIEELKERHAGFLSVCTAIWLCPELVKAENMGSEIPVDHNKFADYVFWDRLTEDGCWGKFEKDAYSVDQLAAIGKTFWTTFIAKRGEVLQETLDKAWQLKMRK